MVEAGVSAVEDLGESSLDQRVGSQDQLAEAVKTLADLGKDVVAVMDKDPANAPAGDKVLLGKTTDSQDRDGLGQGSEREELVAREDQVAVNLVSDHRQVVTLAHGQEVEEMLLPENGAAGVRRVVHDDGGGALIDQRLKLLQVHLPVVFGLNSIKELVFFSSIDLSCWLCLLQSQSQWKSSEHLPRDRSNGLQHPWSQRESGTERSRGGATGCCRPRCTKHQCTCPKHRSIQR